MRVLVLCALVAAMLVPEAQAGEPKRYTMVADGYVVSYPTAPWQGSFKVSRRTTNAPVAIPPFDARACAEVRLDAWDWSCVPR